MPTHAASNIRVGVCVATRARPVLLRQLLDSLTVQRLDSTHISFRVVVIDNDPNESARSVVAEFSARVAFPVTYDVEPTPGIAAARNRAVALARDVEFVAFIDDDEQASPVWLASLLAAHATYDADMVIGPVIPDFAEHTPSWIVNAKLFDLQRYRTGATPRFGYTGNALISRELLDRIAGPFDLSLGLTGGSDTHMFERLKPLCRRFVWSDEALVSELVPISRSNLRWLLRRHFRLGNSAVLLDRKLPRPLLRGVKRAVEGCVFASAGLAFLLPAMLFGRGKMARALCAIARGSGIASGLLGYRYEEYRRVHGG